jgi:GTPase
MATPTDPIERILATDSSEPAPLSVFSGPTQVLASPLASPTRGDLDREERQGLRRVVGLSTELEDVTEVEYRELRLEKVVLIGVYDRSSAREAENSLKELAALCETAGAQVLDGVIQRLPHPDASTYLGKGKAQEVKDIVWELGADTVVADSSQHAKTREGKAQVELAQLQYLLPRLRGWGESMSRQAGGQVGGAGAGMGSRGPGETKIELDRRRINTRMAKLRTQIKGFGPSRETKRANRRRTGIPNVAITGYTNAGKSSLLNRLTNAGVLVEDALFATLDATVRKSTTPSGRAMTLTDTVGFVRNLPHELVEAFRSTLEEVGSADVIVHVVDASHPDPGAQLATVRAVISEVGASDIPEIVVFNKVDIVDSGMVLQLRGVESDALFVSAYTGEGIEALLARIDEVLPKPSTKLSVTIPFDRGELVARLHNEAIIESTHYDETGTSLDVVVDDQLAATLEEFVVRS